MYESVAYCMLECQKSLVFCRKIDWLQNEEIREGDKMCAESAKQFIGQIFQIGQDIWSMLLKSS